MNTFLHWFEYPFQSHIGSNICSSQVPRAKSQEPSAKWPSPLIRSLTLYQRLMTVPPQGTNCPFHNRERTTCGTQDEAGTRAGPSPPKIQSSTQHQCFTTVPQKGANEVSHSAGSRHTCRPPSRCGCGWCSGTISAGPSRSAGRLVLVFRTAHRAPSS